MESGNSMERASRSELLSTINNQKEQLSLYKTKLRDVVAAYKSITKEKEALEASVAVLSASDQNNGKAQQDGLGAGDPLQVESSDPLSSDAKEPRDELSPLRNQIKTLSSSLTTLTQEKNKLEVNFIADKKQLKQDIEDLHLRLAEENKKNAAQTDGFEMQIAELKSRLRTQQLEREKDQTNHSLMLKELQELVTTERMRKEQLLIQLEETKRRWKETEESVASIPAASEMYERQIQELQKELTSVHDQIKAAEIKSNQPSPFVLELQQEMGRVKENHQRQIAQEKVKASESEVRLQSLARQSEDRVSSLEEKLSELSQTVGNYERLRCQDQQQISKLRERVTQLDLENTALVHAANQAHDKGDLLDDHLNAGKIVDQIMHLRDLLIAASEKSEKQIKLSSIFVKDLKRSDEEVSNIKHYKNELEKVKEEFERFKTRTQSVLKAKNKDNSQSPDVDILKDQNLELRNKLRISIAQHQEESLQFEMKVEKLNKTLSEKEGQMKTEIFQLKLSHQKEIGVLELELKKQRERTVAMLSEKEQEFKRLFGKRGVDDVFCSSFDLSRSTIGRESHMTRQNENLSEEMKAVNKLLNLPSDVDHEAAFLHFHQERARTDVEITALRKQKREVETAIRESNALAQHREMQLKEEINSLKEQQDEIERQNHREGANMEYLKNVLLKFFTSTDLDGKKQMMKALMTILQFSPQERKRVQELSSKGWWTTS